MDKLKEQLAPVLKYWFWITSTIVLLGSVGIWWMSSGKLITEYTTASGKIEGDANQITNVSGKLSTHPNPKSAEEMSKLIKSRTQEVLDAWTSVYERQKKIFVWPDELQEDFLSQFRNKTPIELTVQFPTEPEVESSLRKRYELYIGDVLPGIAEIAKTKWTAVFEKNGGGSAGMEMSPYSSGGYDSSGRDMSGATGIIDDGPLVVWETGSQQRLLEDLFPWRGHLPTTLDVLYSQENLWILRQMMYIIRDVNGDAIQKFQAKIHQINTLQIGSKVKTTAGVISKPSMGAAGMMGMDPMSMSMDMSGSSSPDMGNPLGMGVEPVAVDPGDNRYVDLAGKPITASQLRGALTSKTPSDAFMAVAKRVPVMMSLRMDQRSVPDLIAKCGSAPLTIEVRQVRILPKGASGVADNGMSGMSGSGSSGSSGYSGMESMSGMSGSSGMSGMSGMGPVNNAPKEPFPMDLDVEIYGIIYIYNPPLEENLGIEKVTEEALAEAQAQVEGRSTDSPAVTPAPVAPAPSVTTEVAPADNAALPAPAAPASPDPAIPASPAPDGTAPINPAAPVNPASPDNAAAPPAADAAATPPPNAGALWQRRRGIQFNSIVVA